jgi:hypothetical protein
MGKATHPTQKQRSLYPSLKDLSIHFEESRIPDNRSKTQASLIQKKEGRNKTPCSRFWEEGLLAPTNANNDDVVRTFLN